jgi:hypothetical protein
MSRSQAYRTTTNHTSKLAVLVVSAILSIATAMSPIPSLGNQGRSSLARLLISGTSTDLSRFVVGYSSAAAGLLDVSGGNRSNANVALDVT